jgi:hypothetical protein
MTHGGTPPSVRHDGGDLSGSVAVEGAGARPLSAVARASRTARLARAAVTAAVVAALFTCYLFQSRTIAAGPDGSSLVMLGWAMGHGNPLLHGWWVADVTFYTTEVPLYAFLTLVGGLGTGLIHIGGAFTYTLLVLLAAAVARGPARGRAGFARSLLAAGVMLAPQLGSGTRTLLQGPDHTGTAVPLLVVLLLIDRGERRWWVSPAVFLVLAWAGIADALIFFIGAAPVAIAALILAGQGEPRREPGRTAAWRFELSLALAAIAAVPAALAGITLIGALGGWRAAALHTRLATAEMIGRNLRVTGEGLLELFGADPFGASSPLAALFAIAHLVGLALVLGAVLVTIRRFFNRQAPLVEAIALTAIAVNIAALASGVQAVDILSARDIAPVLPLGALLAGRVFGDRLAAARPRWRRPAAGALACYAAMLGYAAAQPSRPASYGDLAGWLTAHHLTAGISGYTEANILTVCSGGKITVRPVGPGGPGKRYLVPRRWEADSAWYDPAANTADFVVLADTGAANVTGPEAMATFGPPARTYRYRSYAILVWNKNLLAALR